MSKLGSGTKYFLGAALSLGLAGMSSVASAADIAPVYTKAPIVGASMPLDVHGYADYTITNGRVTPGGLRIYPNRGSLSQFEVGLSLDIYKNPAGFINSFTMFGGIWNEIWSSPPVGARTWQEMDWWVGGSVGFAKYYNLSVQSLQFEFPGGGIPTARMVVVTLSANDKTWGLPIALNPYVNWFYNYTGGSTVVLGKTSSTYRVELGIKPSISMMPYWHIPLSFTFPTWVTLGPSSYWNRNDGTTNFCGSLSTSPCSSGGMGLFSTGIQAKYSLEYLVPKRLGNWYLKGGVQYYRITNDSLLGAQVAVGSATSFPSAEKDVFIYNGGIGFTF
jgi:hypothetical protein